MGIGGAPEGVLAACAIRTLGGTIQARLWPRDDAELRHVIELGHDPDQVLHTADLAGGRDVVFAATGVTDGDLLRGVSARGTRTVTHSVLMQSGRGAIEFLESHTDLAESPPG